MSDPVRQEMLARWRAIADRCRETLAVWRRSNFRVIVNGIDITDAEMAATEARMARLGWTSASAADWIDSKF